MLETVPRKVMLAVPDDGCSSAAVEFAADEARRRRSGLHLVHVVRAAPGRSADVVDLELVRGQLRSVGAGLLEEAADAATTALDDRELVVTTELAHGRPANVLNELSARAGLVVLDRRRGSGLSHIPTMSTLAGVAARAASPVVVVPRSWRRPADPSPVVVGLKCPEGLAEVVRIGLALARLRSASVRLVHAWHYSDLYDDLLPAPAAAQETERLRGSLVDGLADLLDDHRDLDIEVVVGRGRPADALVAASSSAQLVVLGRHGSERPWERRLGSITRAVLREAVAPVVVVDPTPPEPERGS